MRKILKGAVVLLIAIAMVFSTVAIADTQIKKSNMEISTNHSGSGQGSRGPIVWDNEMNYDGLITAQLDSNTPFESKCADDFHFEEDTEVSDVHWIAAYWNGDDYNTVHWPWGIMFYADDGSGTKPGNLIASYTFPVGSYTETLVEDTGDPASGIYYEISVDLPLSVSFYACHKYWISFQGIGDYPPQSGVGYHFDPIRLHEAVLKSDYFGFPDWTDLSIVVPPDQKDLCFQLTKEEEGNPSIDVEKYVWNPKLQEWADADTEPYAVGIPIGDDVTFKIVIHNNGDVPLVNIIVLDTMHDSLTYKAGDPDPDHFEYNPPYYFMEWYFPGPLYPCDVIEIYITATVEGPEDSLDFNAVEVEAYGSDQIVFDEDMAYVLAKKKSKSINMPFFNWLQNHPNMFPLMQKMIKHLELF